jgi:hypothetical protein
MDNNDNDSDSEDILNINVNSEKKGLTENEFRVHFSSKRRKLRCDRNKWQRGPAVLPRNFLGGRFNTMKLSKH